MKKTSVRFGRGFHVLLGDSRSQAASMVIPPKGKEGGKDNRHGGSDQWLYVTEGSGKARIYGRKHRLKAGSLLLIERGDGREILNTGRRALKTLNFYVPPAYAPSSEERPTGRG
jgi:mannose-6-phosphate isomerase-like protein (cupin superfamily)